MSTDTQTVIVNFGDDATTWFREIAAAIETNPREINVQLVGGACPPTFETVSLRNMLLQVPSHINLVTTAACSLPPLTCAAWLVGDERHIARDAVVWIPEAPEYLMRGTSGASHLGNDGDSGSENDGESEADGNQRNGHSTGPRRSPSKRGFTMAAPRFEDDVRLLFEAINEWFPSWEFSGSCLKVDDLIEWNVVLPQWTFGGRSRRTRLPSGNAARAAVDESREKADAFGS
jgi:hypothetical protein